MDIDNLLKMHERHLRVKSDCAYVQYSFVML